MVEGWLRQIAAVAYRLLRNEIPIFQAPNSRLKLPVSSSELATARAGANLYRERSEGNSKNSSTKFQADCRLNFRQFELATARAGANLYRERRSSVTAPLFSIQFALRFPLQEKSLELTARTDGWRDTIVRSSGVETYLATPLLIVYCLWLIDH